jgi:hypothetical protein
MLQLFFFMVHLPLITGTFISARLQAHEIKLQIQGLEAEISSIERNGGKNKNLSSYNVGWFAK